MKSNQLEFNWDEKPEPAAKAVGEGGALLEELRIPEPPVESTESTSDSPFRNYDPSHPWYYLLQGDNRNPIPADQIPATEGVGRFIEREVPKNPFKRQEKLRELLAIEIHDLQIDIERYQEIAEKGVEALSRYDREIAYGGNDELARASSLALKFNHIAWGRGRVAWLEQELGKGVSATSNSPDRKTRRT